MNQKRTPIGRRKGFTAQRAQRLVAQYRQSGLTQREFIRQHGIGLSTLQSWLRRIRRHSSKPADWVEVDWPRHTSAGPGPATYALVLGGAELRLSQGFDVAEVKSLVDLLRQGL